MVNRVPLPGGTTLGKSYEYGMDVNIGTAALPQWQPIRRMSAFAPTFPPATSDIATYDDMGSPNEDVTGRSLAASFTVQGNRSLTTGMYLPELERLVAAARAKGEAAVVEVRFYHKPENGVPNPNDAGKSDVRVEMSRQNTGNADTEIFSFTLTGRGEYMPIANPFEGWGAVVPQISFVGPANAETGALVTISGSGFIGATKVTIDGADIAADDIMIVNASAIVVQLPAGDAGDVPVTVTNTAGVSQAFTFTRG